MSFDRRRFLKALGLGALALPGGAGLANLGWASLARAGATPPPRRTVFICTGHGHVWNAWHTPLVGLPTTATVDRDLVPMAREELSETLRPFHAIRDRILPIEGLCHTTVLGEFARYGSRTDIDLNNHNISMAHLLCTQTALQRGPGVTCVGGGISIDQELGRRSSGPGRFVAPVWGANHYLPYSFIEAGREAPRVENPERIYEDLLGIYRPPTTGEPTRADRMDAARASVVDAAAREYDFVLARLGAEGRRKLENHRDLLRDLERSLSSTSAACDPTYAPDPDPANPVRVSQYFDLAALALSCDLTRVITIIPDILRASEFGYPAEADVHGNYAHSSVDDGGEPFSAVSERAMIDYNVWYGQRVAAFLERLASIREGDGSLLDHTAVVWVTELGSPTHQHVDPCTLLAGGTDFFRLGRYVRYARDLPTPFPWGNRGEFMIGPSTAQLYTTLLRWMGHDDAFFGSESVPTQRGGTLSLRGTLAELHR
jgi:hypothetical protein